MSLAAAAASRCAFYQAHSLVNHLVGVGLRRFPVSTKARDVVLLSFVNTGLIAQGDAWVLESYELATVVERLMKCAPCAPFGAAQHERFSAETLDYVARQHEQAKIVNAQRTARAAVVLAGRKPTKANTLYTEEFLRTQHTVCQNPHCTRAILKVPLPEPEPRGKVTALYKVRTTTTALICFTTCLTCKTDYGYGTFTPDQSGSECGQVKTFVESHALSQRFLVLLGETVFCLEFLCDLDTHIIMGAPSFEKFLNGRNVRCGMLFQRVAHAAMVEEFGQHGRWMLLYLTTSEIKSLHEETLRVGSRHTESRQKSTKKSIAEEALPRTKLPLLL